MANKANGHKILYRMFLDKIWPRKGVPLTEANKKDPAVLAANEMLERLKSNSEGLRVGYFTDVKVETNEQGKASSYSIEIMRHTDRAIPHMTIKITPNPSDNTANLTIGVEKTGDFNHIDPEVDGTVKTYDEIMRNITAYSPGTIKEDNVHEEISRAFEYIKNTIKLCPFMTEGSRFMRFFRVSANADAATHHILTTCACADRGLRAGACHACLLDRLEAVGAGDDAPARGAI